MKTKKEKTKICSYISGALMICLIILQFSPFWYYDGTYSSINDFVWKNSDNIELVNYLDSIISENITADYMLDKVGGVACWQIVLCMFGAGFAFIKPHIGIFSLFPLVNGIFGTYNYVNNSMLQAGRFWQVHLLVNILMIITSLFTMFVWIKKDNVDLSLNQELTPEALKEKIAGIKALGSESKNKNLDEKNVNFNKLLNIIEDKTPECRIAACEVLGKTNSDIAFTKISHYLKYEKDERVINAMRNALRSIRENTSSERLKKA